MPTRPDSDRWLFGVTLALCLFGAVMILSASAVTAEQLYGHSYIFLVRQAAWLLLGLLGMFVLMRTDYHKLRQPAVIYAVLSTVLVMRSEEHTSELQSRGHLVCRLLLE